MSPLGPQGEEVVLSTAQLQEVIEAKLNAYIEAHAPTSVGGVANTMAEELRAQVNVLAQGRCRKQHKYRQVWSVDQRDGKASQSVVGENAAGGGEPRTAARALARHSRAPQG